MEQIIASASIERILKRAADRQAKRAQKRVEHAFKRNPFKGLGHTTESAFADALSKALKNHGARSKAKRESIRMTAPDTGGRPFHFDHTAVSRKSVALKQGEAAPATSTYGKRKKEFARPTSHTTTSGAHMAYIERDGAAEEFDAAMGRGGRELTPERMQGYLEDDEKTAANAKSAENGSMPSREVVFSFGTPDMGETLEERVAFWSLAEKHAMGDVHTIQHRFIVELPHECSANDRLAIMRSFTARYDQDGVPYWCVLHAPVDGKNDDRNFHAHIVIHGRPAKKISFAADGIEDGTEKQQADVWDFAAITRRKDEFRKTRDRYLSRQDIPESYRGKFVANERKRFAQTVNAQMVASGTPVRYDHRSYKSMGLPVEAMKSIKGMILEKSKAGERLILDTGQTKRLIDFEIERISRERQVDLSEVERIKRAVKASASRLTLPDREAKSLGRHGLARHASHALKKAYAQAALRYALAKQAHVKREIELRLDADNLRKCVEATDLREIAPLKQKLEKDLNAARAADVAAAATEAADLERKLSRNALSRPLATIKQTIANLERQIEALPDPEIVSLLHTEATAELRRVERDHARALAQSEGRMKSALRAWSLLAARPAPVELPHLTEHASAPPAPSYAPKAGLEPEKGLYRHYPESAHDMLADMFSTPHARIALELNNRIADHIQEAAKIRVPGRTTAEIVMEEVKALTEAFKKGRAQAEIALRLGPRDRTTVTGVPMGGAAIARAQREAALRRSAASDHAPELIPREVAGENEIEQPSIVSEEFSEPPTLVTPSHSPRLEDVLPAAEGEVKERGLKRKRERRRAILQRQRDFDRS